MKKLLTTALATFLAVGAFAQVDPNRTVAVINGEEIKGNEYYHRMEFLPGVGKRMGSAISEFPPGFLTLEQLITERLVFQLAKQKGVMPTDSEISAEYTTRATDTPDMEKMWLASGRTIDELKYQIKYDLAQFKIQTFGVTVTNQEVESYYNSHPDDFTIPKRFQLRVIVLKDPANKTAVDSALSSGKSFADVATQYSVEVSKARGGEYGTVPVNFLSTTVRTAIEATKIGQTTAWIDTELEDKSPAYLKFLLEDAMPAKKIALDDKVRRQIRRKLMSDRGQVKNNIQAEMKTLRQNAKVDIKQPDFAEAYRRFVQAYLNEK